MQVCNCDIKKSKLTFNSPSFLCLCACLLHAQRVNTICMCNGVREKSEMHHLPYVPTLLGHFKLGIYFFAFKGLCIGVASWKF